MMIHSQSDQTSMKIVSKCIQIFLWKMHIIMSSPIYRPFCPYRNVSIKSTNCSFVRGIQRSLVNSPDKDQRRGALMFSLIFVWNNSRVNNKDACDLRRHRFHYDVILMWTAGKFGYHHFMELLVACQVVGPMLTYCHRENISVTIQRNIVQPFHIVTGGWGYGEQPGRNIYPDVYTWPIEIEPFM